MKRHYVKGNRRITACGLVIKNLVNGCKTTDDWNACDCGMNEDCIGYDDRPKDCANYISIRLDGSKNE